jgi:hypothetical protein
MKRKISIVILLFPIILSTGIFTIPFVSDYANNLITEESASQTGRWFWGHIISGFAFGISIIVAHYITQYLNSREQKQTSIISLSLITLGGTLLAIGLGADGIGPVATISGGSQASVFFEGSGMMVTGIFMAGIILFGFGLINQIIGLKHTGLLSKWLSVALVGCAILFIGASAIPSSLGLYFIAYLSILIYGSLSFLFWHSSID